MISKTTGYHLLGFWISSTVVYAMMTYGGIRSPDSEVMFRTAFSLVTQGTFAQTEDIKAWPSFGLPRGVDGNRYSIFGPGQAIAAVPLVDTALLINKTQWYEKIAGQIPISYYVEKYLRPVLRIEHPANIEPHALRMILCGFNVIVGGVCVAVFFLLVRLLMDSDAAASYVTVLFAFGSLFLQYTGTFFSEPLALLFILLSLYPLVWNEIQIKQTKEAALHVWTLIGSDAALGLAIVTHIAAILFVPFFFLYALSPFFRRGCGSKRDILTAGVCFAVGLGVFLVLLGYYNVVRFGNVWETGRTADPNMVYATMVMPWRGLHGLLSSSFKGILWYCPAVLAGIFLCRPFYKKYPFLTVMIFSASLFRLIIIATRSDWHGGFCLGACYLVMLIPLLLLPLGECVVQWGRRPSNQSLWGLHFFPQLAFLNNSIWG